MKKEEVIQKAELISGDYVRYLKFEEFNATFNSNITYQIFFDNYDNGDFELTDEIMESLNIFLEFDNERVEWIKKLCFDHYEMCIMYTDYGTPVELLEQHNNDYKKANKDFFKIYDADESFKKAKLQFADILEQENDGIIDIWLVLSFAVPWETEHGMKFHFKNKEFSGVE